MSIDRKTAIYLGAGAAAVIALLYVGKKAGGVIADTAEKFNPLNDNNLIYQGANGVYRYLGGSEDETIGTAAYGALHTENNQNILSPTNDQGIIKGMAPAVPVLGIFSAVSDSISSAYDWWNK